jgi:hypothetical protein
MTIRENSPEAQEETSAEAALELAKVRGLSGVDLSDSYFALQIVRIKLSLIDLKLRFLWDCLLVEAATAQRSDAYLTCGVCVFEGWVVAALPLHDAGSDEESSLNDKELAGEFPPRKIVELN